METHTQDILEQVVYPKTSDSRVDVARQLLNPFKLMSGGGLWLVGALLAISVLSQRDVPQNSRTVVDELLLRPLGMRTERFWYLTVHFWQQAGATPCKTPALWHWLWSIS